MCGRSLHGNRETPGPTREVSNWSASGRRGAEADDGRGWGVRLRHSSREADEQSGAIRRGVGGAKGGGQGEGEPARHGPGTGPGSRVTRAGAPTASCKAKEEGTVHHPPSPHQRGPAGGSVWRSQGECRRGCRRTEVGGLRARPRAQSRGLAWSGPPRSISGTADTARTHTQAGWTAAPARGRGAGGQDRPTGSGRGAERDLRGGLPRVLVRVPTGARRA